MRVMIRDTFGVALILVVAACPAPSTDSRAGANADQRPSMPIDDTVAVRLANEAGALFDTASSVASGPRSCDPGLPAQSSTRCMLTLTTRADAERFSPNAVGGRYAVLAAVTNGGDLAESRTRIPAGATAYLLVEQGSEGRARGWYFTVDHGNGGRVVPIREITYQQCDHRHGLGPKPLGAWRRCADGPPSSVEKGGPSIQRNDLPAWFPCGATCCVDG